MNKRSVMGVIALVVLGASMGFLWRKHERAQLQEPEREQAQARADAHQAMSTDSAPAAAAAAAKAASAKQLAEKLRASIGVNGNAQSNGPQVSAAPVDLQKVADLHRALTELHADFGTQLQLTEEESAQFLDLLARQQVELAEFTVAHPGNTRDIHTLELADNAEQAAMLVGKYPQWLQYQHTELQQNPIDQLQGVLGHQGLSLGDTDSEPLVAALAAEQKRFSQQAGPAFSPEDSSQRQQLQQELQYGSNSRQLAKVASRYLTPQQVDLYQQLLEQRMRTAQSLLTILDDENGE